MRTTGCSAPAISTPGVDCAVRTHEALSWPTRRVCYPSTFVRCLTLALVAAFALCVGPSCKASYPTPVAPQENVGLQVQYLRATQDPRVGGSVSLVAYSIDSDGAWMDVTARTTWRSADSAVVVPAAEPGTFNALAGGTTDAIAAFGGVTAAVPITVVSDFSYPRLDFVNVSDFPVLGREAGAALSRYDSAAGIPRTVTSEAVWTSSNTAVATATLVSNGLSINPLAVGTTRITAVHGGRSRTLNLSVPPRR